MAFESLSEKLSAVFNSLRGKGKLTEKDIDAALREVRMALLEADVSFRVVKQFIASIKEKAMGTEVLNGLNPAQTVIKIVNDELISLMGSETTEIPFQPGKAMTVIMLCGLQGSGKTTTAAKLAGKFKTKGKTPLLAALDVYRPGAVEQLRTNAEQQKTDVFFIEGSKDPVDIAIKALDHARAHNEDVVILDTAGRLQVDDEMMDELVRIKEAVTVHQTILVVDAMTGQEAVNVADSFNSRIGLDGVILSKMDGDTRGGAALSVKAVTGCPILYVGTGEKLGALEQFYPDRMAGRILGMGDVLSLIEKANESLSEEDEEKSKDMASRVRKGKFDFNDYLESMHQMRKLGGISSILGMLPGMGISKQDLEDQIDEQKMKQMEAIVLSMTKEERANPKLLTPQRKFRIAKGSGNDIAQVNRFVKQFEQMQKMMKQLPGMRGKRRGMNPFANLPGRRGGFPF
ncbi:MAG: signal recognition particle protein [Lachnospiraceae bacterium]|nr:signal recognition particle protein [Lachnospiraceae bacterium]